jgi:hypothetical protein
MQYKKPAIDIGTQILHLKQRGLQFKNEVKAAL